MKRVLYVECNEDGTTGGSHKILVDLVTRLSPDYEPVVLFYEDNRWADHLREKEIEVHAWDTLRGRERVGLKNGGKLSTLRTLVGSVRERRRFMRDERVDIVHLNNSPFLGDDWLPAAWLAGVPCVCYAMGDQLRTPGPIRTAFMRRFDVVFPLSRVVEDGFVDMGLRRDRMVLTYPGVDVEEAAQRAYRPAPDVRAEFGVRPDQVLAVMVGNVRRWKGQHVVIEALGRLAPEDRDRLLVLMVGETSPETTEYQEGLVGAVEEHALGDTVRFTGLRRDVPDLLEAADIAIHASIQPEPFGLTVQEAMLHGCATVAANTGGPVEMLSEDSGRMFDTDRPEELAAHLTALIRDPVLRGSLGDSARRRVADLFDVARHVEIIEDTYTRILS